VTGGDHSDLASVSDGHRIPMAATVYSARIGRSRCDAMRCDAMRCDAMRCDAMQRRRPRRGPCVQRTSSVPGHGRPHAPRSRRAQKRVRARNASTSRPTPYPQLATRRAGGLSRGQRRAGVRRRAVGARQPSDRRRRLPGAHAGRGPVRWPGLGVILADAGLERQREATGPRAGTRWAVARTGARCHSRSLMLLPWTFR
jgi:hypothetical protein